MPNRIYRLFVPVAVWYTRRSDITLQREMNLAEGVPAPMNAEELRHLIDTGRAFPAPAWGYCVQYGGSGRYFPDHVAALEYLCKRGREDFILRHLDEAVDYAAKLRPAAMAEAAVTPELVAPLLTSVFPVVHLSSSILFCRMAI